MKKWSKKILVLIMVICTLWYIGYNILKLDVIDINEIVSDFCKKDELVNAISTDTELILVNSKHGLNKNIIPEGLTIPNIEFAQGVDREERHVAGIIAKPLEELYNIAKKEGVILLGNSGYRSYKLQKDTYKNRVKSVGKALANAYVAKPGFSEHQTGLCIDITNESGNFVKGTKEADWLEKNCYKFGFIIRYPYGKKDRTGIEYEPWHIRYVGKKAAEYIYFNGITLEEYLEKGCSIGG